MKTNTTKFAKLTNDRHQVSECEIQASFDITFADGTFGPAYLVKPIFRTRQPGASQWANNSRVIFQRPIWVKAARVSL